jgi:phosphoribosylformimino-5-aminoimidazole carboxamide ribonucleotide (ProFAR) isomerase
LIDIVDDGTTVGTYGGQLRATYSTLNATKTASGGAISLDKMETLHNAVSSGSQLPTIGVCSETV